MIKWPNGHSYSDDPTESQVITWQHDPEWSELMKWSIIMHNEVITWQQEVRGNHSPHWLHLVYWRMPLNSCCRRKGLNRRQSVKICTKIQQYSIWCVCICNLHFLYISFILLYTLYMLSIHAIWWLLYVEFAIWWLCTCNLYTLRMVTVYFEYAIWWSCIYLQFVYFEEREVPVIPVERSPASLSSSWDSCQRTIMIQS